MAKKKQIFTCTSCGAEYGKWYGKCTTCGEWNSIEESSVSPGRGKSVQKAEAVPLSSIAHEEVKRLQTGINEFNIVCGGGMVPGSIILVGGDPGIGKSTIGMQIANSVNTLYVSGEESPVQIRHRADRLSVNVEAITITTATDVDEIIALSEKHKPDCIIIDSIQTLCSTELPGIAGSVTQIRESASRLSGFAKKNSVIVILIGHITKDGAIAGPKLLEHLVDTVLYFEGDFSKEYRILRSFKNRYGSINEIGLFQMTAHGLEEVKNKNKVFLNPSLSQSPGNAVSAAIEGSRIILFEVQSLVTISSYTNPRRMADGFDLNRLILLVAVLEKHAGLNLSNSDVFLNVSGGFQINDTAADLAVAAAIASSLRNKPIPQGVGFLGELSLSGEVRPVSQCTRRVQEFRNSGYQRLFINESNANEIKKSGFAGEVVVVSSISQALGHLS